MALNRALAILEVAAPIAETIPLLGTPVKGAFEATTKILKYAEEVKANKEKTKELALYAVTLCKALTDQLNGMKLEEGCKDLGALSKQVSSILSALSDIQSWTSERAQYGVLQRTLNKSSDSEALTKLRQGLQDAFDTFMLISQVSITHHVEAIDRHVREIISDTDRDTLNSLGPVPAARYDSLVSPEGCLAGTRVEVIDAMLSWVSEASDKFSVFWLAGHAGTGKSTIAKTFCERVALQGNTLLASFFASKSSSERRDPSRILYTFVCELAHADGPMRKRVLEAIHAYTDIKQRPLREQIDQLLVAPVRDTILNRPIVLVIDALDECFNLHGISGARLIQELVQVSNDLPIKLVVTSRMEDDLKVTFNSLPQQVTQFLHEIQATQVNSDVEMILKNGFKEIISIHGIATAPWPTEGDIETLTQRTGRLMIYASTVLKFVGHKRFSPAVRLQQIIQSSLDIPSPNTIFEQIDNLYTHVLETATEYDSQTKRMNSELCNRVQYLLGALALVREPLSLSAFATLINIPEDELDRDARALSSVLMVGPDADGSGSPLLRIFHPSFRDFLLERCNDDRFSINQLHHHHNLAHACLGTLNKILKHDICQIKDVGKANNKVNDPPLQTRLRRHVSGTAQYACQFWIIHLAQASRPSDALSVSLRSFTALHLLHWVELLSLMGRLPFAAANIPAAVLWCQRISESSKVPAGDLDPGALLSDTRLAILTYFPMLRDHALQTYLSLLVTIPHCPLLQVVEAAKTHDAILSMSFTRSAHWSLAQLVIEGQKSCVTSIAISRNGKQVISGAYDHTARLWDAQNGSEVAQMNGHTHRVTCVAFSSDGVCVASGSDDCTICIWEIQTGQIVKRLTGHEGSVRSVASSPNSLHILSGSDDSTLRLWDTESGRETRRFVGHSKAVRFAVFSNNGPELVSGSDDCNLRLWSADLQQQGYILTGHSGPVTSGAFSLDGTRIISGSYDKTIRLWDVQSREPLLILEGHTSHVRSVAYSPDGLQIASASKDKTIRLWNSRTGQATWRLKGHSDTVTTVVYSPDGTQIASSSLDSTVRLWDTSVAQRQHTGEQNNEHVRCVVFSPDGDCVASGSDDGCIWLWDPRTGKQNTRLDGHHDSVAALAFSMDSVHLASGSADCSVRLWDIQSRNEIAQFQGHVRPVSSIAFSSSGFQLVSGSLDRTIRLWSVNTRLELARFEGHTDAILSVAVSDDGSKVVSGSSDRTIRIWEVRTQEEVGKMDLEDHLGGSIKFVRFTDEGSWIYVLFRGGVSRSIPLSGRCPSSISVRTSALNAASDIIPHQPVVVRSEPEPDVAGSLVLLEDQGWLLWCYPDEEDTVSLSWLPVELRDVHSSHGSMFVTASASTGSLIFIDFAMMVEHGA